MGGEAVPKLAEWILQRCLRGSPSRPFIVGDLREEYRELRTRRPFWMASVWYWWEVLVLVVTFWRDRRGETRSEASSRASAGERRTGSGDSMSMEVRQALRFLVRRPGLSGAIVLTVALAIAATTVAFAVVDGVLLEALPYPSAERVVVVWERNLPRARDKNVVSPANFLAWRERARSFSDVASAVAYSTTRTGDGEPERIGGVDVTASFFRIFEASPLLGRLFTEEDDRAGGPAVVVLSEGYWRRAYGGDASIIGSSVTLNGRPNTIIGVLRRESDVLIAAEFGGTGTHDVWSPAQWSESAAEFSGRYLQVFARLAPGSSLQGSQQEMAAISKRLLEEFPDRQAGWGVNVITLREQFVGEIRTTLLVIFGAVCFVLLIACANVANLLLTRAVARQQEMAVRTALGAGRTRLLRQLLIESLMLSLTGGVAGIGLAYWSLSALVATAPDIPRADTIGVDGSVVLFALLATIGTAVLFGLAPALHVVGRNIGASLKTRETGSVHQKGNRLREALIVAQFSLCLVLLVGAGLLIRSFANRLATGVGFDTEQLLTAEINLPGLRYDSAAQISFFEELVPRIQAIPGVSSASAITFAPLAGSGSATSFWAADRPVPPNGEEPVADLRWVHRDFHRALGVPLLEGRMLDETDRGDAPLRALINESGARQLWPGESAVGKRLFMPWNDTLHFEIVGVVGDVLFDGPETERRPMFYWDHRQFRAFSQMTLVVRTAGDPTAILPAIRRSVRELDPDLPVFNVRAMDDLFADALARPQFATLSLGLFAALALVLAAVGIYGVIAYATQQRHREIGIRIALGARRGDVIGMVLRQGAVLVAVALVIGAAGALVLSRLLEGLVFEVSTADPVTFLAMGLTLASTALLATWLPARRASRIPPVEAIRNEQ